MDISNLTAENFQPHRKTIFSSRIETDDVKLELETVDILGEQKDGRSFSLVFVLDSGSPLAQGTYLLNHPAMGELALFLVPIMPDKQERPSYESIFNRQSLD